MAKHDDGGPAYPCPADGVAGRAPGMTLLDVFAKEAMGKAWAQSLAERGCHGANMLTEHNIPQLSYELAAAMIAEKRRRETAE